MQVDWTGVYPAVTTKFTHDDELDLQMFGLNLDARSPPVSMAWCLAARLERPAH